MEVRAEPPRVTPGRFASALTVVPSRRPRRTASFKPHVVFIESLLSDEYRHCIQASYCSVNKVRHCTWIRCSSNVPVRSRVSHGVVAFAEGPMWAAWLPVLRRHLRCRRYARIRAHDRRRCSRVVARRSGAPRRRRLFCGANRCRHGAGDVPVGAYAALAAASLCVCVWGGCVCMCVCVVGLCAK